MATLDRCLPGAGEEIPSVTRREDGATGIPAADCRRYRKGDIKHQIANVVKPVMQGYKFQSVKEFKALLGLFHVTVEEAHKTIKGKTYHGLVYAATDEKGERTGVAIKSSKIGKSVGYEALQKKFVKSKQ